MRQKAPSPTAVLLVRHGLTPTTGKDMPYAGAGPPLSEEGRRQAEAAAQHIVEIRPDLPPLVAIYTSPLIRTRQTAAIVGEAVGLEPVEKATLADCNMGSWAGLPLKELARKPEWQKVVNNPSGFQFPGGETMTGMQFRLVETARSIVADHPGQSVVVVSHADPIKALMAEASGTHLDLFQRIQIAPASVSLVMYGAGPPTVMFVNWTRGWPVSSAKPEGHRSPAGASGGEGESRL